MEDKQCFKEWKTSDASKKGQLREHAFKECMRCRNESNFFYPFCLCYPWLYLKARGGYFQKKQEEWAAQKRKKQRKHNSIPF